MFVVARDTIKAEGGTTGENRRCGDKLATSQSLHTINVVMKWRNEKKKRKYFSGAVTKLSLSILGGLLILLGHFVDAGTVGWFYALEEDRAGFEKVAGPPVRTISLVGGTVAHEYRAGPHTVVAARMGSGCVGEGV